MKKKQVVDANVATPANTAYVPICFIYIAAFGSAQTQTPCDRIQTKTGLINRTLIDATMSLVSIKIHKSDAS